MHDEDPRLRGICRNCTAERKQIYIPEGHMLSEIHKYSEKNTQFFKMLAEEYPTWGGFTTAGPDEHIQINYRETPEGADTGAEMVRKTKDFPDITIKDFQCICCQHDN